MPDLFQDKAADWDTRPVPAQISAGVGRALFDTVSLDPTMRVLDFGAGTGLVCGTFHPPGMAGVFHHGFDRDALAVKLAAAGFVDTRFQTACSVHRDGHDYPIFLVTATRG